MIGLLIGFSTSQTVSSPLSPQFRERRPGKELTRCSSSLRRIQLLMGELPLCFFPIFFFNSSFKKREEGGFQTAHENQTQRPSNFGVMRETPGTVWHERGMLHNVFGGIYWGCFRL